MGGEAASADTVAEEEFSNLLGEVSEEGGYLLEHVFNADETHSCV